MDVPAPKLILLFCVQGSHYAHLSARSRRKLERSILVKTNLVTIGERHLGDVVGGQKQREQGRLDRQRITRVHQSAINLSLEQLHGVRRLRQKARNTLADLATRSVANSLGTFDDGLAGELEDHVK